MKLINANLESIGEAADRMVAGEVLYDKNHNEMHYYEGYFSLYTSNTPVSLRDWSEYKNWKIEKLRTWEDDASKESPVLCFVTDTLLDFTNKNSDYACYAYPYNSGSDKRYFNTRNNTSWKYAWPVEPKDCWSAKDD